MWGSSSWLTIVFPANHSRDSNRSCGRNGSNYELLELTAAMVGPHCLQLLLDEVMFLVQLWRRQEVVRIIASCTLLH